MDSILDEFSEKKKLVKDQLQPLLVGCKIRVIAADYVHDTDTGSETVTLTYRNGYQKNINVSADSYAALVRDVFSQV